jgi:hypothetical protein
MLIQSDAEAWLNRPTRVPPEHSVHSWPWEEIPDAATLDGLYAELWAEIERQGATVALAAQPPRRFSRLLKNCLPGAGLI